MHKNTKVDRYIYKLIKTLKGEGFSVNKTIREVYTAFDISLSESTVRRVRRSKNYKQYRLECRRPPVKLDEYEHGYRDGIADSILAQRQPWYSHIPIIRVWMEKLGL
jgi:hypothetical protein